MTILNKMPKKNKKQNPRWHQAESPISTSIPVISLLLGDVNMTLPLLEKRSVVLPRILLLTVFLTQVGSCLMNES